MRGLGVGVEYSGDEVLVHGRGMDGLVEPSRPLECGGSGTTMRLMSGLLAGLPFYSVLAGNAQLSRRPMDRVARPLREMGATILGREGSRLAPLSIQGGNLTGITYRPPVASAQIKSAVLLAGLFAAGETAVEEPTLTRDHTERMLKSMGADLTVEGSIVRVQQSHLKSLEVDVPGDISSAAFILAAAAIIPGSRVVVEGVGVNPGRTGFLRALERMGVQVRLHNEHESNGEPVADIEVSYGSLQGISIAAEDVPGMIDELPLLAVIATQAEGATEVRGAAELRVKETDRIATTATELTRMGARIEPLPDGFRVHGFTRLSGARVHSHDDHRLAMSLSIAALVAEGATIIEDTECVDDSFPGFEAALKALLDGGRAGE
jgi:3-phosphoshikimate 1-carboxyvinyltransferase